MLKGLLAVVFVVAINGNGFAGVERVYKAKYLETPSGKRELIFKGFVEANPQFLNQALKEISYPQMIIEDAPVAPEMIFEIYGRSPAEVQNQLERLNVFKPTFPEAQLDANEEVVTLIQNGPSNNRIDLVFMGDGYTVGEKDKFFSDVQMLVRDIFEGPTYKSYLPIFNIHAVFRASNQSGIGVNNTPKDTAYGLYREGNTLRAIFPTKTWGIRESCARAPGCDFPVIVANDPFYGGLGGEVAITTSSPQSGAVVLRHELGHNFGRVGEEYDGYSFFGANYSPSVSGIKWTQWLSGPVRAEPAVARLLVWPWQNLSSGPYAIRFQSDGRYPFNQIRISASGNAEEGSIRAAVDGMELPLKSPGNKDRTFQDFSFDKGLSIGNHDLKFWEEIHDGDNWVSSVHIHEYAYDFHFDDNYISAYPVFSSVGNQAGFRPTNEGCLMRDMNHATFCPICQENNWLNFFALINTVDGVDIKTDASIANVVLKIPLLGQFRSGTKIDGEQLGIAWFRNGQRMGTLDGKSDWQLPIEEARGNWKVRVTFQTPEVRKDNSKLLEGEDIFKI